MEIIIKKYLLPMVFMSLLYWSCEEEVAEALPEDCAGVEGGNAICGCLDDNALNYDSTATFGDGSCIYDTTEPTLQFISPNPNDTLGGIITFRVEAQDDYEVKVKFGLRVTEFDVGILIENDSIFTDMEAPYEYEWNSTEYGFVGATIHATAYDSQNESGENYINIIIDNRPEPVNVTSVEYVWNEGPEYIVQWEESADTNFQEYIIYWVNNWNGHGERTYINTVPERAITSHAININGDSMAPTDRNWFWVEVKNSLGHTSGMGDGMHNEVIGDPVVVLEPIVINNDSTMLTLTWSQSSALGTSTYQVWESTNLSFGNITHYWYPDNGGTDTTITVPLSTEVWGFDDVFYYKVDVFAHFGREGTSNVEPLYFTHCNDDEIILWGDCYNTTSTTQIERSSLAGSIPSSIGDLVNLTELIINNGELSGPIPPEIGNLTNLTKLDISDNQINSDIPPEIGNLVSLQQLILYENELSSELPPELGDLTNLTYLHLGDNQLTGSIPPEIGDLTNLIELNLGKNSLTEIPSEIGNLTNLEVLYLGDNQLTGSIPAEIGNLTNLEVLYLGDNQLTGLIPPEIGNLTNLIELNLGKNSLTEIPSEIGNLINLTHLDLHSNQLTGEIPSEIGNLTNLTDLNLEHNALEGAIPHEIGNLTNLIVIDISWNGLIGEIPSEIGNLTNLSRVSLNENQLTGEIPSEIGNLANLTTLSLYKNQLTGEIPESICELVNLTVFQFAFNHFCPPYPDCIIGHTDLEVQDQSDCILPPGYVELLGNYYSIEHTTQLYLQGSGLTGSIPSEIFLLTNLEILTLHSNQLTGPIPVEIGNLTNLVILSLSHNQLTGSIPSEIGNLTNLEELYLRYNQLTGEIPESICNLVENNCSITLTNNQLCLPYPSCIEDDVGEQDTSDCP